MSSWSPIALANAAATDAILLAYASDSIMKRNSLAVGIPLAIIAFPSCSS